VTANPRLGIVKAGDIALPMEAILGFADVAALMAVSIWLVTRWVRRHPVPASVAGSTASSQGHATDSPHHEHGRVVEMGESRTPRPEPFARTHYERVR
jgi:hypothetical protein